MSIFENTGFTEAGCVVVEFVTKGGEDNIIPIWGLMFDIDPWNGGVSTILSLLKELMGTSFTEYNGNHVADSQFFLRDLAKLGEDVLNNDYLVAVDKAQDEPYISMFVRIGTFARDNLRTTEEYLTPEDGKEYKISMEIPEGSEDVDKS